MAFKMCLEPRCPEFAVYRGRCKDHNLERERGRPNRQVYDSVRWRYTRRHQLRHSPLCEGCGRIATDVDHVRPIEDDGACWDSENLQSLCASCHSSKTAMEMRHR